MNEIDNRENEYTEALTDEELYLDVDFDGEDYDAEDFDGEDHDAEDFEDYDCEDGQSIAQVMFENYCDNLVFPDEEKCIDPKKLYITLGSAFAGAVVLFLFIGWLLCYCPLNHTGFSAKDFIAEYNSIVSEGDATRETFDAAIAAVATSPSDVTVLYPDFSQLIIPEDANLEKGVELCGGDMIIKADLVGGNIQKLTVSISETCTSYNPNRYSFNITEGADFDYSHLPKYAAAGKARLAFYNLVRSQNGLESTEYSISDALSYCSGMLQGAIYSFADADDYDPDQSYFEYTDNLMLYFTPVDFCFTADSREYTLSGSDNGIYKFFDSIFGKKETDTAADKEPVIETPADSTSGADISGSDVSSADAE